MLTRLGHEPATLRSEGGPAASLLRLLWTLSQIDSHANSLYADPAEAGAGGELAMVADGAMLDGGAAAGGSGSGSQLLLNRKLNGKLLRQLADPLALCSRALPLWCASLAVSCPFLFAFESRRFYFYSTAFGLSRALQRLQNAQEGAAAPPNGSASERSDFRLGRLPRQKVRISRARVMDSALKVMDLYASAKALLEVEYFGEVGTGLGPTLEFYTLVSRELRRSELRLWLDDGIPAAATATADPSAAGDDGASPYVFSACGLYPRPVAQGGAGAGAAESGLPARAAQLFGFMGKFVAKALLDSRLVDLPFSATFYKQVLGQELTIADLATVRPELATTLRKLQAIAHRHAARQRATATGKPATAAAAVPSTDVDAGLQFDGVGVSDLGLDFTLPGLPEVELVPEGAQRDVTLDNCGEFVQRVLDVFLAEGVRAQVAAFRQGFTSVFAIDHLAAFSPDELEVLFNGSRERWDVPSIIEYLKFDHGYTRSSRAVGFLLEVLCEFDEATISAFLKFVTGSPRLPVGGLARLNPRLTVVQKRPEDGVSPDAYLPSVMT